MTDYGRRRLVSMALLLIATFLTPPLHANEGQAAIKLGVMPYLSTRTLLSTYQPVADALEKRLQQPVQLLTAPDFNSFVERLLAGDYDLAILAPHYARMVIVDRGFNPLLRHAAPIRGLLVTSRDHPLQRFSDLQGASIAVVDRSALLAIVGTVTLADQGLIEGRDYRFVESVSHSSALHSAITGGHRVALISHTTLALAPPEIQSRTVVWQDLNKIPGLFYIAHPRMTSQLRRSVLDALLEFEKSPAGKAFNEKTQHGGYMIPSAEDSRFLDRLLPETRRQLKMKPD